MVDNGERMDGTGSKHECEGIEGEVMVAKRETTRSAIVMTYRDREGEEGPKVL